ncbi:MAG: hypothetical protein ABWY06_23510 [Pseudomonas sp.]|uniref:hypothetical protein n=1 Tax=Pseudomonas sp. TaxID=306 RepID=UPI003396EB8D
MIKRQQVVSDFFAEAESLRTAFENRVRNSYQQGIAWRYFCVPQMYTYLSCVPQAFAPEPLVARFMRHLTQWCLDNLGMIPTGPPNLHLMVNGCTLGLHSDFHNGTWGFVYSLTRWEERKFSGGETLLMRDGVPSYKKHHVHGEVLYELFPAHFNQLLLFDDRIVHGTRTIEGSMDPLQGRIALVGHLRATSPRISGPLEPAAARQVILAVQRELGPRLRDFQEVQGSFSFRLAVTASGAVESITALTDNLVTAASGYQASAEVEQVRALLHQALSSLQFAAAAEASSVTAAVLVPLPELSSIEVQVPHQRHPGTLLELLNRQLRNGQALGFQAVLQGDTFVVQEPLAGSIRIEATRILATFEPPMWVPSQRDHFETALRENLEYLVTQGG